MTQEKRKIESLARQLAALKSLRITGNAPEKRIQTLTCQLWLAQANSLRQ